MVGDKVNAGDVLGTVGHWKQNRIADYMKIQPYE